MDQAVPLRIGFAPCPNSIEDDSDIDGETTRLLKIMRKLRDPDGGCPWDIEQDFSTIAPYTIEEAYEVSDAIERGDFADLKDELGDLLLQVVFHARMAEETGHFAYKDIVCSHLREDGSPAPACI